ncbi:MAG: hypothetical protein GX587_10830 [Bacteroidales bacterium]|nr:hypothetical protein [Bacteroidales bacterium]
MSKTDYISRGCKCAPDPQNKNQVYSHGCNKLNVYNWLNGIPSPEGFPPAELVEIRFKNSRKDFFIAPVDLELEEGDIVAVEATPGHDIGIVTLTGELVIAQMKKKRQSPSSPDLKKVYRRAKPTDIEKWISALELEIPTMYRSREFAVDKQLQMKISDVEYQGDKTKAIFYYTADDRVDFRELIKIMAEAFGVRIEMRQIGMRQEASRLGGIGSCGRELCCATWLTSFKSVSTVAARNQQLSLNPQKLAGQCSKLKCCINYENDCYVEAAKELPDTQIPLVTKRGRAHHVKTDVLKKILWYAYDDNPGFFIKVDPKTVVKIQQMNAKGAHPEEIEELVEIPVVKQTDADFDFSSNQEDDLNRFDEPQRPRKKKKNKKRRDNFRPE